MKFFTLLFSWNRKTKDLWDKFVRDEVFDGWEYQDIEENIHQFEVEFVFVIDEFLQVFFRFSFDLQDRDDHELSRSESYHQKKFWFWFISVYWSK